jgi:hypothetical protein
MKQFVAAVGKNSTLKMLSVLGVIKGNINVCESSLAKIPLKSRSITDLNLSDNRFSDAGNGIFFLAF